MRPRERREKGRNNFFKSRLDQIVDMKHPLAKLARQIDWAFGLRALLYAIVIQMRIMGTIRAMTTSVVSVRVNEEERALLEAASELARTSLSDFVRRKALDAAETDIVERRIITIPARDWEALETSANRPPEEIAGLKDLARTTPKRQK